MYFLWLSEVFVRVVNVMTSTRSLMQRQIIFLSSSESLRLFQCSRLVVRRFSRFSKRRNDDRLEKFGAAAYVVALHNFLLKWRFLLVLTFYIRPLKDAWRYFLQNFPQCRIALSFKNWLQSCDILVFLATVTWILTALLRILQISSAFAIFFKAIIHNSK